MIINYTLGSINTNSTGDDTVMFSINGKMRELTAQSSNDTNVSVNREYIQREMDELAKEVSIISNNSDFNTQKLIDSTSVNAQISGTLMEKLMKHSQ